MVHRACNFWLSTLSQLVKLAYDNAIVKTLINFFTHPKTFPILFVVRAGLFLGVVSDFYNPRSDTIRSKSCVCNRWYVSLSTLYMLNPRKYLIYLLEAPILGEPINWITPLKKSGIKFNGTQISPLMESRINYQT